MIMYYCIILLLIIHFSYLFTFQAITIRNGDKHVEKFEINKDIKKIVGTPVTFLGVEISWC